MWTIETQLFEVLGDSLSQGEMQAAPPLRELFTPKQVARPTFIIGNGLSLNAVYENRILYPANSHSEIGWSEVVDKAFNKLYGVLPPGGANSLVVAEAILQKTHSKEELLKDIQEGVKKLIPSALHRCLLRLQPHALITTNYDFLLEDVCESQGVSWQCFVRDAWKYTAPASSSTISIFKMHGTLPPEQRLSARHGGYHYPSELMQNSPESSVVISEKDYDTCNDELDLSDHAEDSFWQSLMRPVVILGKGVYWEDLSFMRMLRLRKSMFGDDHMPAAYWILNSITPAERLTLNNLGITPVVLNMPRKLEDATFYFSLVHFFDWLTQGEILPKGDALTEERQRLLRKPKVIAIGLSAHNTAGRVKFSENGVEDFRLPAAGRRNLEFADAEEFAGGSALTAVSAYAALSGPAVDHGAALVSVVGEDIFSQAIFVHCDEWNIDADAITSKVGQQTWRSTVLVHNFRSSRDRESGSIQQNIYPGQRVFLDRPFPDGQLGDPELRQFAQMLTDNDQLRVIYLDKWLADDPGLSAGGATSADSRSKPGFLAQDKNFELLRATTENLPAVDVIYETGGSGSSEARVERRFAECINIVTAGFPFFARRIIKSIDSSQDNVFRGLYKFLYREDDDPERGGTQKSRRKRDDYRTLDFEDERNAILDVLAMLNIDSQQSGESWCPIANSEWEKNFRLYVKRESPNRWFVVTLHDLGAIAFNLNQEEYRYFPAHVNQQDVLNTSGAGDTFRGAFSYALANLPAESMAGRERLERCTRFAVYCASERCTKFKIADALIEFRDNEKYRRLLFDELK